MKIKQHKTNGKRILCSMIAVFMAALLINTNVAYVRADEAEENLIENAKNSVFLIQTCLVDEANEENYMNLDYPAYSQGTCFLVGNINRGHAQRLITAKSNLAVPDKVIRKYRKQNHLEKDAPVAVRWRILISSDIICDATLVEKAGDSDYAILGIDRELPECNGIALGNIEECEELTTLFQLSYNADNYSVNMESTSIHNLSEQQFEYQSDLIKNYGAPLVDEEGRLIGMRIPGEDKDEMHKALAVSVMQKTFDKIGIKYDSFASKQTNLQQQIEQTKQLLEKNAYTKKTKQVAQAAIETAQKVYEDPTVDNNAYQEQIDALQQAAEQLKPMHDIYMIVIYILAGIILLLLIILLVRRIVAKKREKRLQYHADKQFREAKPAKRAGQEMAGFREEGTVALDRSMPTAYLLHKATGKKILLSKTIFTIGSKEELVDYCIQGNHAISRRHAALLNENGIVFLQDLGSMNHSYINDVILEPNQKQVVRNGDRIRLANEEFVFEMK